MELPPNEYLERVRCDLGWSYANMGQFFGVSDVAVFYWCKGTNPVPKSVTGWIPMLEEAVKRKRKEELLTLLGIGVIGFGAWWILNN